MDTPFSKTLAMAGSLEGPETPISTDSTVRPSFSLAVRPTVPLVSSMHLVCSTGPAIWTLESFLSSSPAAGEECHLVQMACQQSTSKECMLGRAFHLTRVSSLACRSDSSCTPQLRCSCVMQASVDPLALTSSSVLEWMEGQGRPVTVSDAAKGLSLPSSLGRQLRSLFAELHSEAEIYETGVGTGMFQVL